MAVTTETSSPGGRSSLHDDLQAAAAELVRRSTAAQGLPEKVTDPAVIAKVAAVVRGGGRRAT